LARHWVLDPEIVFLNHGSFGACPRTILDRQHALHLELEREPLIFLDREFEPRMRAARETLAAFLHADPDDLAPVPNASAGVNSVLRSLDFKPGDELLVTDHEYNACTNALAYVAQRNGAHLKQVSIPFPVQSEEEVVSAIVSAVTPATRLLLVDHITSPTALVLPIARIVAELNARGVDTLVDGAHAPGQVPIDLSTLNAAYYTGNLHKWLCAPKGAAFLWVRRDRQDGLHPLPISHGYNAGASGNRRFRLEFDWTGTADPTPFLCAPDCISFLDGLFPGGMAELMRRNHDMALVGRDILLDALNLDAPCPDSMIGSMASLPLPDLREPEDTSNPMEPSDPLRTRLLLEYGIEAHIVAWPRKPKRLTRLSAQVYNTELAFHLYAHALKTELGL
jgi:isopenicillin-N epimerase